MSINDKIRNLEKDNFLTKPLNRPLFINPSMLKSKNQLYNNIANSGGFGDTETNNPITEIKNKLLSNPIPQTEDAELLNQLQTSLLSDLADSYPGMENFIDTLNDPDTLRRYEQLLTDIENTPGNRRLQSVEDRKQALKLRFQNYINKQKADKTNLQNNMNILTKKLSTVAKDQKAELLDLMKTQLTESTNPHDNEYDKDLAKHLQSEVYSIPENRRSIQGFKRIRDLGDDEVVVYKSKSTYKNNEVLWGVRGSANLNDFITDAEILGSKLQPLTTPLMTARFERANKKYLEIRKRFPNARIIMGGHSLGNAIGLEVLKNHKDPNMVFYGFNGYRHTDYNGDNDKRYHTIKNEGDAVSWISDNSKSLIETIKDPENRNKLIAGLGSTPIIAGIGYTLRKGKLSSKLNDMQNSLDNISTSIEDKFQSKFNKDLGRWFRDNPGYDDYEQSITEYGGQPSEELNLDDEMEWLYNERNNAVEESLNVMEDIDIAAAGLSGTALAGMGAAAVALYVAYWFYAHGTHKFDSKKPKWTSEKPIKKLFDFRRKRGGL